jgi:hypothetical protein
VSAQAARGSGVSGAAGVSLVELMLVLSMTATLVAIAVPQCMDSLDEFRTRAAAHYLAMRLADARMDAIKRSTRVGLRFEPVGADYRFTKVEDGDGDGLSTVDVERGTDPVVAAADMLAWHFTGVRFGILAGLPDADGLTGGTTDGIRLGSSGLLTMNPNGSSSSGTLYLHGRGRAQYAVRVLGATGRVRILHYVGARRTWGES